MEALMKHIPWLLSGIIVLLYVSSAQESPAKVREEMNSHTAAEIQKQRVTTGTEGEVTRFELSNGMTVLLEENHSSPVVAVNVWVKVGSACEEKGEFGLAHVHEHMVFKGTKKRGVGEIAKLIEGDGGDINAFTSFDHTVYFVEIASRYLDTALDVLSDVMVNSAFDPGELKKELEVIVEEINRGDDSPTRKLSEKLFSDVFSGHPYGRPIIGTKASVRSFTREKVVNFYKKWYTPQNMVLVIVGDFNSEELVPKVVKTFGAIPSRPTVHCDVASGTPNHGLKAFVFDKQVHEGYFAFGFRTGGVKSEDTPALDVIANILGGGESSRLYRQVKEEKGLANTIYAYSYTPEYAGLFAIGGSFDPKSASKAVPEIIREAYRLKHAPVSREELARAKVNIESESIYAKETMNGQAQKLGFFQADTGDYRYEREYLDKVHDVTPEDIIRVANKYFDDDNLTVGVLFPTGKAPVSKGDLASLVERASAESDKESAGLTATGGVVEKRVVLENGIRLIVKEEHSVPLFAARAVVLGGLRYEREKTNGISDFLAEMFTRGAAGKTSEEIAAEIESLAGSLDGFSGRNSLGVTVEALSRNFDPAFDLFSDVVLSPSFPDEEIERARRDILAHINAENDNLTRSTVNLFLKTLYKKHPYRMNTLGTEETVSRFSRDDLRSYYHKLVVPKNLVITVVGDVNTQHVVDAVKRLFGGMHESNFKPIRLKPEPSPKKIRTAEITRADKEQAHIILGFLAPSLEDPDQYPFEVLNSVLSGQGGRLFLELRDRQSLAYTITSFYTPGIEPGYFGVYIGTAPEKKAQAIAGIKAQLGLLLKNGITDEELKRAQNYLVGNFEIGLQQDSSQTARLAFDELYGLGWDSYKGYADKILSVTKEDVARVAKKYIKLNDYVLAVVSPEGKS